MPDNGVGAPGGRSLTRDKLVSLQIRIYFWILTERLPKQVTCVFRRLGLAWLGYLAMFKRSRTLLWRESIHSQERSGIGDWAPSMNGAIHQSVVTRPGRVTIHPWVAPRSHGTCRPAVLFVRRVSMS
jgi:hypothetical protein